MPWRHDQQLKHQSDPLLETRIAQYELAFKMIFCTRSDRFAGGQRNPGTLWSEVDKPVPTLPIVC